jgi:hypothetical protein
MKQYRLIYEVTSVHGVQSYLVEAENEEDALEKHNNGKSDFEGEELEVTDLEESPTIEEA